MLSRIIVSKYDDDERPMMTLAHASAVIATSYSRVAGVASACIDAFATGALTGTIFSHSYLICSFAN